MAVSKTESIRKPGRPKGTKKTGGRQKGSTNKLTTDVKEMILTALENKGGVDYLMLQADENPTAFLTLIGKVLPMTVATDPDNVPTFSFKVIHE